MIQIRDLSFAYHPGTPVLRGIDLDFRPGEYVAILGPNGSGKSTLLRCISGLAELDKGSIETSDGIRIGLVFQNPDDQIVSPLVESEIAFGLENAGIPREEMVTRVDAALERFDLERYRRQDPHSLSGGERQRLAIAAVTVMRPDFLLLDEPDAMLDPASREELSQLILSLASEGVAPILVTQDPDRALDADRLIVLDRGQIAHDSTPADILGDPGSLPPGLATTTAARLAVALEYDPPVPTAIDELMETGPGIKLPSPGGREATETSENEIVRIDNLSFTYDAGLPTEHPVLRGLSLSIPRGAFVSLMGPSGSGKSTLALHLNGLHEPTEGTATVTGLDVADSRLHDQLRQRVGLVFQFPESQLFAETVRDDVGYGPGNLGLDDIEERVCHALDQVGLSPERYLDRNPLTLSGGEKRRVALAGVLATAPELLVLDEPTAGLDPSGGDELDTILRDLNEQGTTIVMITHDLSRAVSMGSRIVGLLDGQVVADRSVSDFLADEGLLSNLGIPLPRPIQLIQRLRGVGVAIPDDIHTSDQLISRLSVSVSP